MDILTWKCKPTCDSSDGLLVFGLNSRTSFDSWKSSPQNANQTAIRPTSYWFWVLIRPQAFPSAVCNKASVLQRHLRWVSRSSLDALWRVVVEFWGSQATSAKSNDKIRAFVYRNTRGFPTNVDTGSFSTKTSSHPSATVVSRFGLVIRR